MKAIKFKSLSSGSCGNCYFLGIFDESDEGSQCECSVLVDAGVSPRRLKKELQRDGLTLDSIAAILITHDHMDHLDEGTLRKIDLCAHLFAAPASCREHLRRLGVPQERLLRFDRGESFGIVDAELHAVFADHTEDSIGLVVRAGGRTIYFTGDTLFSPRLAKEAAPFSPDILVTCINGRWGNMGAEEAADVARALDVKVAIPTHYGMFAENTADPMDFVRAFGAARCRLLQMYEPVEIEVRQN